MQTPAIPVYGSQTNADAYFRNTLAVVTKLLPEPDCDCNQVCYCMQDHHGGRNVARVKAILLRWTTGRGSPASPTGLCLQT